MVNALDLGFGLNVSSRQGPELTFLCWRQLATRQKLSVARWQILVTSCEILVANTKFLVAFGDFAVFLSPGVEISSGLFGSLRGVSSGGERGLISRTAAGYRA